MNLQELLHNIAEVTAEIEVSALVLDSRHIVPGSVFVALPGAHSHGLAYAEQVIARGASAIIYDPALADSYVPAQRSSCLLLAVANLNAYLGEIAARFYKQPSQQLGVIGITGTNGKTSCSQFLGQMLEHCGIIGTLGWGTAGHLVMTGYTTPDALSTQTMLAQFVQQQCPWVAMEVSSHGLAEGRVNAVRFKGVVLTNISRDHLDFHGSMDAYIATKLSLFTKTDTEFAVINLDDALSARFLAVIPPSVKIWGYSAQGATNTNVELVSAANIQASADGLRFDLSWQGQQCAVQVPFYGTFNVENLLAVASVLLALNHTLTQVAQKLMQLQPVNGRMQRFGHAQSPLVFVDYAHTPDALEKVLKSAREHCPSTLWVVFGCGGDRDVGKRAQMGAIAERYADHVLLTNDNPRSEDPMRIIADILSGCQQREQIEVIPDRAAAIGFALARVGAQDCVVVAGKGHEDYQEIAGTKIHFSDAEVVMRGLGLEAVN